MNKITIGADLSRPAIIGETLTIFCGPCVIESLDSALGHAEYILKVCEKLSLGFVFKSSYDKANRTSVKGYRGVGIEEGMKILSEVRSKLGVPVVTDTHTVEEAKIAARTVDVIQIPAFLCRQTDLLVAAGETKKPVLVKKGQFLHPSDMEFCAEKIRSTGNSSVMLCERGTSFGYRELVVDYRSLEIMRNIAPVIFDATHSVQIIGGAGGSSAGNRAYVPLLARAAVAVGVDGVFIEAHKSPDSAPSDGPNMLQLDNLETLLRDLKSLSELRLESRASL